VAHSKRIYNQFCPFARTLDILGERWTLLVIRNLLIGPLRYKDLLDALPGIGTNLLADRLKGLESADIVRRRKLPPPAGSTVYELTELGRGLEAPLLDLARWGLWTLSQPVEDTQFRPLWGAAGLKIVFQPEAALGVHDTYELRIDGEAFHATVADGDLDVRQGPAERPDVVITTDGDTWQGMASGALSPVEAIATGKLRLEGDPAAGLRFSQIFRPPASSAPPTASSSATAVAS